jgi:hypothetical protein
MKSNEQRSGERVGVVAGLKQACLASCDPIVTRIRQAKAAILAEARIEARAVERMLHLALNEAEAVAWQTSFPHLFFPTLALERVQAVSEWNQRQQSLRQQGRIF